MLVAWDVVLVLFEECFAKNKRIGLFEFLPNLALTLRFILLEVLLERHETWVSEPSHICV